MTLVTRAGTPVAVTGASSGLGREVARRLSGPVIATARRLDRLQALSAETGGRVAAHALDLRNTDGIAAFAAHLADANCADLVLNAGVTDYAPFLEGGSDAALLDVNVAANLALLRAVCSDWVARGVPGRVLIVASIAGLAPVPYQAVYAGTKAFMVNFGLSVREELRPHGITVGVFAPGGIDTEMTRGEKFERHRKHLAPVGDVADALIKALDDGSALTVPGAANKATALASKFLPRALVAKAGARVFKPD